MALALPESFSLLRGDAGKQVDAAGLQLVHQGTGAATLDGGQGFARVAKLPLPGDHLLEDLGKR